MCCILQKICGHNQERDKTRSPLGAYSLEGQRNEKQVTSRTSGKLQIEGSTADTASSLLENEESSKPFQASTKVKAEASCKHIRHGGRPTAGVLILTVIPSPEPSVQERCGLDKDSASISCSPSP